MCLFKCKFGITSYTLLASFLHKLIPCLFNVLFSVKLVSQILHLKGFLFKWWNVFLKTFLRELNLCDLLTDHFVQNWRHKCCIGKTSSFHELMMKSWRISNFLIKQPFFALSTGEYALTTVGEFTLNLLWLCWWLLERTLFWSLWLYKKDFNPQL